MFLTTQWRVFPRKGQTYNIMSDIYVNSRGLRIHRLRDFKESSFDSTPPNSQSPPNSAKLHQTLESPAKLRQTLETPGGSKGQTPPNSAKLWNLPVARRAS